MRFRESGSSADYDTGTEHSFHTQRLPGSTFAFAAQGDSHPERPRRMFNSDLYTTSGDDFGVDRRRTVTADTVTERYTLQGACRLWHAVACSLVRPCHKWPYLSHRMGRELDLV